MQLILAKKYQNDNPSILAYVRKRLADFDLLTAPGAEGGINLVFSGLPSSGKTFLAKAIYRSIFTELNRLNQLDDNYTACAQLRENMRFYKAREMYKFSSEGVTTGTFTADIAILDDLGCELATDAGRQYMSNQICVRYETWQRCGCRLTIITTELSGDELETRYKTRVADRLEDQYKICEFLPINYRTANTSIISDIKG